MDEQFMLKEWHETAGKKLDVLDAICRVSDSWAVAVLCSELEALAIEEHEQLKKLGIHNQAEAVPPGTVKLPPLAVLPPTPTGGVTQVPSGFLRDFV